THGSWVLVARLAMTMRVPEGSQSAPNTCTESSSRAVRPVSPPVRSSKTIRRVGAVQNCVLQDRWSDGRAQNVLTQKPWMSAPGCATRIASTLVGVKSFAHGAEIPPVATSTTRKYLALSMYVYRT